MKFCKFQASLRWFQVRLKWHTQKRNKIITDYYWSHCYPLQSDVQQTGLWQISRVTRCFLRKFAQEVQNFAQIFAQTYFLQIGWVKSPQDGFF
jgi:hypothetical protein